MRLPNLKLSQRGQVILAVSGAAAGTVFGAVVQTQLGSPLNLAYLALAVLCLLVIGLTTTLIGAIDTSKQSRRRCCSASRQPALSCGTWSVRSQSVAETNRYLNSDEDLVVRAFRKANRKTLILQLHQAERLAGSVEPRTLCELVINDPQEAFIGQFVRMWRAVDAGSRARARCPPRSPRP
jgi:hypothetical protein